MPHHTEILPPEQAHFGDTAPHLQPLPAVGKGVPPALTPRAIWRAWFALRKQPLRVTVRLAFPEVRPTGPVHLDALLGAAVLRAADAPWHFAGQEARVIPLPLDLLAVVVVDSSKTRSRRPCLPVWASTELRETEPGVWSGLCIGHADTVRELLSYVHEIGKAPCRGWRVEPLDRPLETARQAIRQARPMPGTSSHFTPPYWHDWTGTDQAE